MDSYNIGDHRETKGCVLMQPEDFLEELRELSKPKKRSCFNMSYIKFWKWLKLKYTWLKIKCIFRKDDYRGCRLEIYNGSGQRQSRMINATRR